MKIGNRAGARRRRAVGIGSRRRVATALALLLIPCAACAPNDASATKGNAADSEAFRPLAVGDSVPAYTAALVGARAGDSVRIGAATAGAAGAAGATGPTLVNVWATWCTACREEFGDLERLHRDYAPRGVRVVAVSVDEGSDEKVARFAKAAGVTFAVAHDTDGAVQRLYQTVGVPETYLVSADGKLLWHKAGALAHGAPEARKALEEAVGM